MIPRHGEITNVKKKEKMAPNGLLEVGENEKEGPEDAELSIMQEPAPRPSIFYQPSKSSNLPFPSRLKKHKKDDEDERLEAMIHMSKGAKVEFFEGWKPLSPLQLAMEEVMSK
ncbi:hypothetical protein Tco_0683353 [Tanacetum coccineum]|uniref:Uncharacterized protein n=1 Tax=Tanacetum coccineum TaxID=301880 RepID=A0ABQ4XTR2_9ASTR